MISLDASVGVSANAGTGGITTGGTGGNTGWFPAGAGASGFLAACWTRCLPVPLPAGLGPAAGAWLVSLDDLRCITRYLLLFKIILLSAEEACYFIRNLL